MSILRNAIFELTVLFSLMGLCAYGFIMILFEGMQ